MSQFNEKIARQWSRMGPRAMFGNFMLELAEKHENLMVMSANLGRSSGLDRFKAKYPKKYLDVGISEQNLIGVASGLAKEGFKVFVTSFAPFLSMRASEQIRMNLGYMKLPVNLVALGSGVSMGFLGNRHLKQGYLSPLFHVDICPSYLVIAADTSVLLFLKALSAIKYLVSKLSLPSTTMSLWFINLSAFLIESFSVMLFTLISGFSLFTKLAALSDLKTPIFSVLWIICLCRFESSILSWSTIVIFPIPRAAKYIITGDPKPPAPTTKTLELRSFSCPVPPISGSKIFLEYLSKFKSVNDI